MQSVEKQLGETHTAAAFQQQTFAEQRSKTDYAETGRGHELREPKAERFFGRTSITH